MPGLDGGHKPPATHQVTSDLLALDELEDELQRRHGLAVERRGARQADPAGELGQLVIEAAPDVAGVARARPLAGEAGLEHDRVAPGAGQGERGREPGIARAHHRHVGALRPSLRARLGARRRLPPVGLGLEVGPKNRFAHAASPPALRTEPWASGRKPLGAALVERAKAAELALDERQHLGPEALHRTHRPPGVEARQAHEA